MLTKDKYDNYFATKIMDKVNMFKNKRVSVAVSEKNILSSLKHPFINSIHGAYQDDAYLYIVLEFVPGGELFQHLRNNRDGLPEDAVRFYAAQILMAFQYLHHMHILYRDLKPENILIDALGYIKLVDFGFSKKILPRKRTYTICGTSDYLAPEIVKEKGYHQAVDFWALGVIIYEMVRVTLVQGLKSSVRIV